jgi:hypothetical protein
VGQTRRFTRDEDPIRPRRAFLARLTPHSVFCFGLRALHSYALNDQGGILVASTAGICKIYYWVAMHHKHQGACVIARPDTIFAISTQLGEPYYRIGY